MSASYILFVEGDYASLLDGYSPAQIERAAQLTINRAADRARNKSATIMRERINFPASYLQGQNNRLRVTTRAAPGSLEAIITGRQRATSLARFARPGSQERGGVRVEVGRGKSKLIKRAFLMPLNSGKDPGVNMGLAVRVERGKRPNKAYKPVQINERLWLLYGPSVDQVFKNVREDVSPETAEFMGDEFLRTLRGGF